jgi:hypothetical protein
MPEKTDTITLRKTEYDDIIRSRMKLACLEGGGVDNWEWYGEAMQDYREQAVAQGLEEPDD